MGRTAACHRDDDGVGILPARAVDRVDIQGAGVARERVDRLVFAIGRPDADAAVAQASHRAAGSQAERGGHLRAGGHRNIADRGQHHIVAGAADIADLVVDTIQAGGGSLRQVIEGAGHRGSAGVLNDGETAGDGRGERITCDQVKHRTVEDHQILHPGLAIAAGAGIEAIHGHQVGGTGHHFQAVIAGQTDGVDD